MAFRVFLDANVLLDLTLQRPDYANARKLIEWVMAGRIEGFITPAIIHVVAHSLTKFYKADQAKKMLLALLAELQVIDIGHETTMSALHSQIDSVEYALQYYTALHFRLDYFISRDKALHKAAIPILPVCTPEEFLKNNQ